MVRADPAARPGRRHEQGQPAAQREQKLSAVVSKLAGHQTARAVIEAMIAGERDPRVLAAPPAWAGRPPPR
jgi:hypothetical protein